MGGYYPPQGMGQDMNGQLIAVLIPLMTTLPALRNSKANLGTLINSLTTMQPLAPLTGPPTQADVNNMITYSNNLRANLLAACNNDQAVFSSISQGMLFQILIGAMGNSNSMGGTNMMLMLILVMALGGSFGL